MSEPQAVERKLGMVHEGFGIVRFDDGSECGAELGEFGGWLSVWPVWLVDGAVRHGQQRFRIALAAVRSIGFCPALDAARFGSEHNEGKFPCAWPSSASVKTEQAR